MKIVRKLLTEEETQPTGLRWDEDCDCVQQNVDGTWMDAPTADPRSSPAYQYPPIATADPACDAGARISAEVADIINIVFDAVSVVEAVNTMVALVAVFFPPVALFVALLFALVTAANAIGFAAVQLAFTDTVYEDLACIVACNIGADGQFDDDEWIAFQDEIGAHFGLSTVTAILSLMFNGYGMVGFNNMVSVGTETGDCTDCACSHCFTIDLTASDGSGSGIIPLFSTATWVSGQGWQGAFYDGSAKSDATISWIFPAPLDVIAVSAEAYVDAVAGGGGIIRVLNPNVDNYANDLITSGDFTLPGTTPDFIVSKSVDVDDIGAAMSVDINCGSADTVVYITRVSVTYRGDEAFGGDNC